MPKENKDSYNSNNELFLTCSLYSNNVMWQFRSGVVFGGFLSENPNCKLADAAFRALHFVARDNHTDLRPTLSNSSIKTSKKKTINLGKLICFYQDHFLPYPTGKEPFTFLDLREPLRHKSKRDPIDIAFFCHNRHNGRWCTFFKPVLFLA